MPEAGQEFMQRVQHIHFVGIGGAGMSGIAEVLNHLGYRISGSDVKMNASAQYLQSLGVDVQIGHQPENINGSDVVVYSSAIQPGNKELTAAHSQRIPTIPRAEMLAELMRFRHGIAIAGTHGKTTTTSLVASVLAEAGLDPTYVIGGLLNSSGRNAQLGSGKYLVAEADESDASFLHLQPIIAVLTNIDADHLETYQGDFQNLKQNFIEFLHRIPFYGLAVVCVNDAGVRDILPDINKPFLTYAIDREADVRGHVIQQQANRTVFTVQRADRDQTLEINLNMPGEHNVQNALAAVAVAQELGVDDASIQKALSKFQGIGRRCEVLGDVDLGNKSVLLMDDYAHHPSEIAATIDAIRKGWPDKNINVVFQPHRYTRTRDLFEDFATVLSELDVLLMLEVYSAGEKPITGADSRSLCRAIRLRGYVDPVFVENRDEIKSLLTGMVNDGDILLVLGAGNVGNIAKELSVDTRRSTGGAIQ